MAVTKKSIFSKELNVIADFAKALSHPARLEILKYLSSIDTCICGDIVDVIPLSQATVSQHLKELKNAGIIRGTIEGVKSCYCIDQKVMQKYIDSANIYFENLKKPQAQKPVQLKPIKICQTKKK